MINAGRVIVNGSPAILGMKIDTVHDIVFVDGVVVDLRQAPPVCVMLNKPSGYVTTRSDPRGRKTVMSLIKRPIAGLHPIGRLDYDSEGLLLLTNDGALTYLLTHPKHEVDKTYEVTVVGDPGRGALARLRSGVQLREGRTSPARIKRLRCVKGFCVLEVVIHQGWNRQVRRMFDAVGHPVVRLKRTGYSFLRLSGLEPGEHRLLTLLEIERLREHAKKEPAGGESRGATGRERR